MTDIHPAQEYIDSMHMVKGWCSKGAAALILAIHLCQERMGITGHLLEIGVHQGLSGILLCNLTQDENERCLLVDSFDVSDMPEVYGVGNLDVLQDNIARFAAHIKGQVIVENMSSEFIMERYRTWKGRVRIAHVDGDHTYEAVLRDLRNCAALCHSDGCIVVHDAFNPHQPGVNQAFNEFMSLSDYAVFAIGYNTAFLCRKTNHSKFFSFNDNSEIARLLKHNGVVVQDQQPQFFGHRTKICYSVVQSRQHGPSFVSRFASRLWRMASKWQESRL